MRVLYHQLSLFHFSKVCASCHIEKPLDQFHHQSKRSPDGYKTECKECRHLEYKAHYKPLRTPIPFAVNGGKVCRKCLIEKPFDQFTPDRRASDKHGTQCRQCMKEVQECNHTPEERKAKYQRHVERNGDQYRAKGREWKRANPLIVNEINRRRYARQKVVSVGKVSYEHILERDGYWCYICEKSIDPDATGQGKLTFDHVIPIAGEGTHSEDNLKPAHTICNTRKGTKLLSEMTSYQRRGPVC